MLRYERWHSTVAIRTGLLCSQAHLLFEGSESPCTSFQCKSFPFTPKSLQPGRYKSCILFVTNTHTHTHTQIILEKSFLAISSDRLWIPEAGMTWPLPFASPSPGPRAPQPTHPATWKAVFFGEWVCEFCTRTARSSILTLDRRVFGQPSLCFRFPLYQVQQQHFLRFRYTNTSKQF